MNRRGFLAGLMAAAVLDPERLLWVPGRKTISIPSPAQVIAFTRTYVKAPGEYQFRELVGRQPNSEEQVIVLEYDSRFDHLPRAVVSNLRSPPTRVLVEDLNMRASALAKRRLQTPVLG